MYSIFLILIQLIINRYFLMCAILIIYYSTSRFSVLFFTIIQTRVERDMLGRVFALIPIFLRIVVPLSNIIFGQIADQLIEYVFIIFGVGIMLSYLFISKIKYSLQEE
ncbi:hypothetical protein CLTEP_18670 [Clostridium tepidiprofundi DSM 19306]|uniref:Major facilitator superfamily protein n=2 Tax=Clostridium TaxID=1485 RepID=A0A151B2S2_9CLOT|nr:hypothetical protein CLTEP_18670 [Clostridium tepidiprofundi DSM 19306]